MDGSKIFEAIKKAAADYGVTADVPQSPFGAADLVDAVAAAAYGRGRNEAMKRDLVGVTRAELSRAILDRAAADLAAIGVECRVSEHRETSVAAMSGPVIVHLGLAAAVRDPDEVVP